MVQGPLQQAAQSVQLQSLFDTSGEFGTTGAPGSFKTPGVNAPNVPAAARISGSGGGDKFSSAFQRSIDSQRKRINQQILSAVDELSRRSQAAEETLGTVQPGIESAFGDAFDGIQEQGDLARGALEQFGVAPEGQPPGLGLQPVLGALQADQAARLSDIPLLELGVEDVFARQAGALGQARAGLMNDLGSQERSGLLQQQQMSQDLERLALQQQFEEAMAEQDFQRRRQLGQEQFGQDVLMQDALGNFPGDTDFLPGQVTADRGLQLFQSNPNEAAQALASDDANDFREMVFGRNLPADPVQDAEGNVDVISTVIREALERNKPRTASLVLAELGIG